MKTHIFAVWLLVALIGAVTVNSVLIVRKANIFENATKDFPISEHPIADVTGIQNFYDSFLQEEKFISLTVSHEDLTNIEGSFAEWIGASKADDKATAEEMKSRLEDAFRHLGRLAKCNFDSIL